VANTTEAKIGIPKMKGTAKIHSTMVTSGLKKNLITNAVKISIENSIAAKRMINLVDIQRCSYTKKLYFQYTPNFIMGLLIFRQLFYLLINFLYFIGAIRSI